MVIAILAAITAISYTGIKNKADASAVQAELSQVAGKLETYKIQGGSNSFPASLSQAGVGNTSAMLTYSPNVSSGYSDYCVTGNKNNQTYFVSSRSSGVRKGTCEFTDGLTGWWKLGNVTESSGNGGLLTVIGATSNAGQNGAADGAYTFKLSDGARLTADLSSSIDPKNFTVSIWFKTTRDGDMKIISGSSTVHIIQIFGGLIRECMLSCSLSTASYNDGSWHFAAAVGSSDAARVYMDGRSVAEVKVTYTSEEPGVVTKLYIGSDPIPSYLFDGSMDDMRVYNRQLSVQEIQQLYSAGAQ